MTEIIAKWNEAPRLAALHRFGVPDAPLDPALDDFVRIAAHVCAAPIALVGLVDKDRVWFAAETGLGVQEAPLDNSVCAHAIQGTDDMLIVPDLAQDRRFNQNPLIANGPKLRFYAGAVLKTQEGLPLGTMCVLDDKPRPGGLTEQQAFTLQALARQVMAQLELRRSLRQRTEAWVANDAVIGQLDAMLAEKDLLMQEAHHRVKNSLATVQALLLLQARAIPQPDIAQHLLEAAGRVHTFGGMHDNLYRAGATSHVDVAAYLQSLIDDQQAAFASTLPGRAVTLKADSALWPSSEAPTLGLIVVELVTNALKYGKGTVQVTFRIADGYGLLTVEDDGQDLPTGLALAHSKGFGMGLINRLLNGHRGGVLEIDRTQGHTCFQVRLNAPLPVKKLNRLVSETIAA
jgi:two-component sensor histidine kinase